MHSSNHTEHYRKYLFYFTCTKHDCTYSLVVFLTRLHRLLVTNKRRPAFSNANNCQGQLKTPQSVSVILMHAVVIAAVPVVRSETVNSLFLWRELQRALWNSCLNCTRNLTAISCFKALHLLPGLGDVTDCTAQLTRVHTPPFIMHSSSHASDGHNCLLSKNWKWILIRISWYSIRYDTLSIAK